MEKQTKKIGIKLGKNPSPLTPKGNPMDGYYYEIICEKHGETQGHCIGRQLVCMKCGEE